MATKGRAGYDGTTGRSDHGGRRTHIIQLLRDSRSPVTVAEVANQVGIHINTARFHLESLVDAGLAQRSVEDRKTPGRPRICYVGTLPNQTHERAQGYRLLAEILTSSVAREDPNAAERMYEVGREWGRYLTNRPAPFEVVDDDELAERVVDKLDALWFAPELRTDDGAPHLVLHNCPFIGAARQHPEVVCSLHVGMVNGSLAELGSRRRAVDVEPMYRPHQCRVWLREATVERPRIAPIGPDTEQEPVHVSEQAS